MAVHDELRERYTKLSSAELLLIVKSPQGRHTTESQHVAASVLASRRLGYRPPPPPVPPADDGTPSGVWATILAIGGYLALHSHCFFGEAKRAGLDDDVLLRVARTVVQNPWSYVVALTACLLILRRRPA